MTALIILAAGESSRLGFPKQTLLYKGKTLIEKAIEAGIQSKCNTVHVVLGANAELVQGSIKQYDINIIYNAKWKEGMASSIRIAVNSLNQQPGIDGAVIMLCDQPFVSSALINSLLYKRQETGKKIIACAYNNITGVPALFNQSLFGELLLLRGADGAKKLFRDHEDNMATIPFEKGSIDIDTLADYEKLINKN